MIKADFPNVKLLKRRNNAVYLISMNGVALSRQQFKEKINGFLSTVKDKNQKIILFLNVHHYNSLISIVRKTLENLWPNYVICGIGEIFGDQVENNKSLVYSIIVNLLAGDKLVLMEKEIIITNYQDIISLVRSDRLLQVTDREVSFYHRISLNKLVQIIKSFLSTTYGSVEIIGTIKNELKNRPSYFNLFYELDYNFVNSIKDTISRVRISRKNIEIKGKKNSDKQLNINEK